MNNWVVANLDESVSTGIGVGTGDKVGPVSDRVGVSSPNAAFNSSSGRIDVVARNCKWLSHKSRKRTYWAAVEHQYEVSGTASVAVSSTNVEISMASLPGRTVWQKDRGLPALLTAVTEPVPSTQ